MSSLSQGTRTVLAFVVLGVGVIVIAGSAITGHSFWHFLSDHDTDRTTGSGRIIEETRNIDAVHAVELRVPARVEITVGGAPSLTISGDDDIVPLIRTESGGGTLTVFAEGPVDGHGQTRIRLTVPTLDAVEFGAGKVTVTGLNERSFAITVHGSGELRASGTVDQATVEIDGTAKLHLDEMVARTVKLTVHGTGDATVHATEALDVEIDGSGKVIYSGSPAHVTREIHGNGKVEAVT